MAELWPLLLLAVSASAASYPLDGAGPVLLSSARPVAWDAGWDALTVAGSLARRCNQRGLYVRPAHWHMRDLAGLGWAVRPCVGTAGALCALRCPGAAPRNASLGANGTACGRVFAGAAGPPRFRPGARPPGLACTRAEAGRVLDCPARRRR